MVGSITAFTAALAAVASATTVNINPAVRYQQYDGMGISEAFERGRVIKGANGLSNKNTNAVLDFLFSNKTGAGLTILRNGIGSAQNETYDLMQSIATKKPATNSSKASYLTLDSLRGDQQQIWLSKQFKARGGRLFYGDSWSADPYMKTNGLEVTGGYLCGVTNATCASGDWRQAYANKLVKWLKDYENHGISYDYIGFLNEPDLSTPYASMQSNGQQAADFIKVLYPTIQAAGLKTKVACCDGSGWNQNRDRLTGIQAAGSENQLGLVTSHGYSSAPNTPFNTTRKVWQTEWSTFDAFTPAWYRTGGQSEGLTWGNRILNSFGTSNVSAFLFWWGAANDTDNQALIWIPGNTVNVSSRLWAHAHWGRLVVQNGYRISATVTNLTNGTNIAVTSFANPDGSVAVQIINNANNATTVTLSAPGSTARTITSWTTNNANNFTSANVPFTTAGNINATIPGRSLVSFYYSSVAGSLQPSDHS